MNKLRWAIWLGLTVMVTGFFSYKIFVAGDKEVLLIGEASHGHYQIQLACDTCHTDAFGGRESLQAACLRCHSEELEAADDSHPRKKFNDPRNLDLLRIIDARYCVTCHAEHQKEQTRPMGLTLPVDYCFHCHSDIGSDRPSHEGLAFDSCASAGCHNFHDNRALYETFLVENAGGDWLTPHPHLPARNRAALGAADFDPARLPSVPDKQAEFPVIHDQWAASSHAVAGVSCGGCHQDPDKPDKQEWVATPGIEPCETCHRNETKGFLAGKHGMRIAAGLSPVSPGDSVLSMKTGSRDKTLNCTSCHGAHDFDTRAAATTACLSCHDDNHSRHFMNSPHGRLAKSIQSGALPAEAEVSCATCHMPRHRFQEAGGEVVGVEHNQNLNLKPNEKMIRSVCLACHNLEFSLDALADRDLIERNFSGQPSRHVPSIDWALRRESDR